MLDQFICIDSQFIILGSIYAYLFTCVLENPDDIYTLLCLVNGLNEPKIYLQL